ncbi:Double zinc ribbon [Promicromonospora umidemergens]|uniref:FHA domain-containing protein n=1 Tax=Promicromonospora umidemergens TaxID=629679 RepID=UPI0020A307BD|nr:FHA domain-containing protein [Promicromonospora umidemergens]MCP2283283.1 Double zinc ribbon [Promicromonospora umidemergens]
MTVTCPEGHNSTATDYCDVCGTPIPAGASAAGPGAGPGQPGAEPVETSSEAPSEASSGGPVTCPNCGEPSPAGSLFCENCGYDFTTGTPAAPAPPPSSVLDLGAAPPAAAPPSSSVPAPVSRPAAPPQAAGLDGLDHRSGGPVPPSGAPTPSSGSAPAPSPGGAGLSAPPVPGDDTWVAEIWVDPDWYAHERPEDPMPSAGLPGLVTLRQRSLLVGRPSQSRGIRPDVDCGSDPGVSRRHCQLTTDGLRWWVEDLGSSNGTFVAATGDPLPDTPLTQGVRKEIEEGDRIFIGAWTRLVIRKALPGEA